MNGKSKYLLDRHLKRSGDETVSYDLYEAYSVAYYGVR